MQSFFHGFEWVSWLEELVERFSLYTGTHHLSKYLPLPRHLQRCRYLAHCIGHPWTHRHSSLHLRRCRCLVRPLCYPCVSQHICLHLQRCRCQNNCENNQMMDTEVNHLQSLPQDAPKVQQSPNRFWETGFSYWEIIKAFFLWGVRIELKHPKFGNYDLFEHVSIHWFI